MLLGCCRHDCVRQVHHHEVGALAIKQRIIDDILLGTHVHLIVLHRCVIVMMKALLLLRHRLHLLLRSVKSLARGGDL